MESLNWHIVNSEMAGALKVIDGLEKRVNESNDKLGTQIKLRSFLSYWYNLFNALNELATNGTESELASYVRCAHLY